MKKVISSIIALCLIMSSSVFTFASEIEESYKIVKSNNNVQIKEKIINNKITRVLTRNINENILNSEDNSFAETKKLLLELGMERDFIDNLSQKDLEEYSKSTQMIGSVSYSKVNQNGDVEYISEAQALSESSAINQQLENQIQPLAQDTYEDSYMRVFYLVTYLGNGKYKFSTDARWLTMPLIRSTDSLGSCAQNTTVTNSTRSGWYEYDIEQYINGKTTTTHSRKTASSSSFKNAVNGNWYGSVVLLNLPNNQSDAYTSTIYENYKAHYEYTGSVNYPSLESRFNTSGTYDHATIGFSITPSISIGISGTDASIGLDITGKHDSRSVELEIIYTP